MVRMSKKKIYCSHLVTILEGGITFSVLEHNDKITKMI